jgi:hypothetical protein
MTTPCRRRAAQERWRIPPAAGAVKSRDRRRSFGPRRSHQAAVPTARHPVADAGVLAVARAQPIDLPGVVDRPASQASRLDVSAETGVPLLRGSVLCHLVRGAGRLASSVQARRYRAAWRRSSPSPALCGRRAACLAPASRRERPFPHARSSAGPARWPAWRCASGREPSSRRSRRGAWRMKGWRLRQPLRERPGAYPRRREVRRRRPTRGGGGQCFDSAAILATVRSTTKLSYAPRMVDDVASPRKADGEQTAWAAWWGGL